MIEMDCNQYAIVADIGGTFARFARVDLDQLQMDHLQIYACADYLSLQSVFLTYQAQYSLQNVKQFAIAIACPLLGDQVTMTNGKWSFSISNLKDELGLGKLLVMNDFSATAMSLSALGAKDIIQIGQGLPKKDGVRVVLGAGTGLGVAYLVSHSNQNLAIAGEGGHASWGATTELEWVIYNHMKKRFSHVSYERLLSGQGLENIYAALAEHHHEKTRLSAAQVIDLANKGQSELAQKTIEQFFACLGSYAGNLALTLGALGGIYIAGGVVPRLLSHIHQSNFRAQFEAKGRFSHFNQSIPTYVITAAQPGILGAALNLKLLQSGVPDVIL